MPQLVFIQCSTPYRADTLVRFLDAEGHAATWLVADGDGPIVQTTAPFEVIAAALSTFGGSF